MTRIVVREDRPLRRFLVSLLIAVAAGAAGAAYFGVGQFELEAENRGLREQVQKLTEREREGQARIEELERAVASHARARQVEEAAYSRVESSLASLQTEKLTLEEEVAFYRGIVASRENQSVRVRRLFLFPGTTDGKYRFQVVLTRNMKDDKVLDGALTLSVDGEQGGKTLSIPASALLERSDGQLPFRFRFFHRLEGEFDLPPEFVPHRVHVRVDAPGEVPASTERAFDWLVTTG